MLLMAPAVVSAKGPRACGSFGAARHPYKVTVERGRVTCAYARDVLRRFLGGEGELHQGTSSASTYTLLGSWTCGRGAGGGGCIRGGRTYRTAKDWILADSYAGRRART